MAYNCEICTSTFPGCLLHLVLSYLVQGCKVTHWGTHLVVASADVVTSVDSVTSAGVVTSADVVASAGGVLLQSFSNPLPG
jgi:hypothetical protein